MNEIRRTHWKQLSEAFGGRQVNQITDAEIRDWHAGVKGGAAEAQNPATHPAAGPVGDVREAPTAPQRVVAPQVAGAPVAQPVVAQPAGHAEKADKSDEGHGGRAKTAKADHDSPDLSHGHSKGHRSGGEKSSR